MLRKIRHLILQKKRNPIILAKGQTAIEYMLLLGAVVAIVLIGMKIYPGQSREGADLYFNRVLVGIMGEPPPDCAQGLQCK